MTHIESHSMHQSNTGGEGELIVSYSAILFCLYGKVSDEKYHHYYGKIAVVGTCPNTTSNNYLSLLKHKRCKVLAAAEL